MGMTVSHLPRRRFARWGMVFRVEQGASGLWGVVGRAAGREPYVLLSASWFPRRDEVQGRLDAWAKSNAWFEVAK